MCIHHISCPYVVYFVVFSLVLLHIFFYIICVYYIHWQYTYGTVHNHHTLPLNNFFLKKKSFFYFKNVKYQYSIQFLKPSSIFLLYLMPLSMDMVMTYDQYQVLIFVFFLYQFFFIFNVIPFTENEEFEYFILSIRVYGMVHFFFVYLQNKI